MRKVNKSSGVIAAPTIVLFVFLSTINYQLSTLYAAQQDVGTSAAQFLKIGIGNPKALSLGRSYVALADGVESLRFNPAGLAQSNSREMTLAISEWIDGFRGHYIAYGHPHMRSNVAFNAAYFTLGDFDVRDENGLPLSATNVFVRTGFATAAFAWSLPTEELFVGTAFKTVFEDYSANATYNFGADIGALWKQSRSFQIGASMLNLSPNSEKLPWSVRGGFAYKFPQYVTSSFDLIQDKDTDLRFSAGLIIDLPPVAEFGTVSLRTGYHNVDDQGESSVGILKSFKLQRTNGISFGFGLETESTNLYNLNFDYALVPLGALGTTHHMAIKFRF